MRDGFMDLFFGGGYESSFNQAVTTCRYDGEIVFNRGTKVHGAKV